MEQRDPLYHDPALAELYDLDHGWRDDFHHCLKLGRAVASVLDFGCGTGWLIAELAPGRNAVGVDPAEAMLAVARARPGGANARWIVGDVRSIRLGERFDLIVMTGHAFQVLLSPEEQLAALQTMAAHLSPTGRFIFDTRNPLVEEWREWTPEQSQRAVEHPTLGTLEAWNDVRQDAVTGIVTYETHYRVPATDRTLSAPSSQLRFTGKDELAGLIQTAGLTVEAWLGDWHGAPWTPGSPEIIPYGRKAP